jgi:HK97 family phage major capsid protein
MAEAAATTMTQDQLKTLVSDAVKDTVAAQVAAALEPLTKSTNATGESVAAIQKALRPSQEALASDVEKIDKGLGKYKFGRKARAMAMATIENGTKDPGAAAHAIKQHWPASMAEPTLKWIEYVKATLAAGNPAAAGDFIIPQYDEEWIELLRNNAVVRGLPGVRTKSMPRGAITQRKQTGAATAAYQGELGPIAVSNLTVGKTDMSYKKLTAATVVSNDEVRFAGPDFDRLVQDDLLAVSALREDRAFLVGNPPTDTGSPQGMRFQTLAGNIAATAGTSLANFQADGTSLISLVQKRNIPVTPQNAGFIWSVSTFWTIYALTTTTGDWVFKAGLEQARPTFLGFPVYLTTQLEVSNSFIGASSGLNIFAHFPSLVIWDSMSRTVETFRGGAYRDESGTIQSGISNDETVITCIAEHDFQQRYQEAVAIKTGLAT